MEGCTFSPTISKSLSDKVEDKQEEYWERLYATHSQAEVRKKILREEADQKQRDACPFHPTINPNVPDMSPVAAPADAAVNSNNNSHADLNNNNATTNNAYTNTNILNASFDRFQYHYKTPTPNYQERMKLFALPDKNSASEEPKETLDCDSALNFAAKRESDDHNNKRPASQQQRKRKKPKKRKPMLYVDIRLSNAQIARLAIYDANACQQTVEEFASRHGLDPVHADALHSMVMQRLSCLKS